MNEAYNATLTPSERHLAHRLESFGDVVFGFTISQLAFQLVLPRVPTDLTAHPSNYVIYFVTFGLVALLWTDYHRMLANFFRPEVVDIVLVFVYLAFLGIVPYAMNANVRFGFLDGSTLLSGEYGFGIYMICAIALQATSVSIRIRNFIRGTPFIEPADRLVRYRRLLAGALIVPLFVVIFCIDVTIGVNVATPGFFLIPVMGAIIRRRVRAVPPLPRFGVTAAAP